MKYPKINSELFTYNRERFTAQMKDNSIAIFHSNELMPQSADATFPFRQNPDLFYLTGIDQEETTLILFPDAPVEAYREMLFIRNTNEYIAVWEGEKLAPEQAKEISGVKYVYMSDEFDTLLKVLMNHADNVYLNLNEHDRTNNHVPYKDLRFANELRQRYPLHNFKRSAPIMQDLRAIKSDIEIELLRQSCAITEKAFHRVLKFTKPGVKEYEIEAEIMHEFLRNGATDYAYYPIIASGKDSCILHYEKNNKTCVDGDILLLDFGCKYAGYDSDMSRTIPINGRYTPRQKQVYNAVLRTMRHSISILRPGILIEDYHKEVGKFMSSELIDLCLLTKEDVANQDPKRPLYKKYFMHGTSHFLGLNTHDVGDRYEPLKAGMVLTCEPGIYIPAERLGIRIENDILVDHDGPIDLMASIPVEAEEIEALMNG
ncbi:aminopeptidase P family protein [soil metagenome]